MKITLIRHAPTEQNFLELCQGLANNALNDEGRRQCKRLAIKIKNNNYDYCYMSPLLRAVETAIILVGDRVETIPDSRLIERSFGELEGQPRKFYDAKKYWDYDLNCDARGVESIQDIFKRCNDFLNYIKDKHKGENILVISHGAPIRVMRHILLKHDVHSNLLDIEIPNLYVEEFNIDN